jgi:hypothetical protein
MSWKKEWLLRPGHCFNNCIAVVSRFHYAPRVIAQTHRAGRWEVYTTQCEHCARLERRAVATDAVSTERAEYTESGRAVAQVYTHTYTHTGALLPAAAAVYAYSSRSPLLQKKRGKIWAAVTAATAAATVLIRVVCSSKNKRRNLQLVASQLPVGLPTTTHGSSVYHFSSASTPHYIIPLLLLNYERSKLKSYWNQGFQSPP